MTRARDYQAGYNISSMLKEIKSPKSEPIILGPFRQLDYFNKPQNIAPSDTPYLLNGRIVRGYLEPRPGLTTVKTGFDNTIMWVGEFILSSGTVYLVVITTKSIYYSSDYSNFTRVPWYYSTGTVVTAVGSAVVTGSGTSWLTNARAGDLFKCDADGSWKTIQSVDANDQLTLTTNYGTAHDPGVAYKVDRYFGGTSANKFWAVVANDADELIFCQGVDNILYINSGLAGVTQLVAYSSKHGMLFGQRLVIGNVGSYNNRVRWSISGTYTDFAGVGSGYQDLVEDPTPINAMGVIGGVGIVYQESAINHMTRTGKADTPFDFKLRLPGVGAYVPDLAAVLNSHLFWSRDNINMYDSSTPTPVGVSIRDGILESIAPGYVGTFHSVVVSEVSEIHIFYTKTGSTTPDRVLIYNYALGVFVGEWELSANASGRGKNQTTPTWNGISTAWNSYAEVWNSSNILSSRPLILIGSGTTLYKEDTTLVNDGGTNFTFDYKSPTLKVAVKNVISYRVVVDYYCNIAGALLVSLLDGGGNATAEVSVTLTATNTGKLKRAIFDFINSYDSVIVRVRSAAGARFAITQITLEAVGAGDVITNG